MTPARNAGDEEAADHPGNNEGEAGVEEKTTASDNMDSVFPLLTFEQVPAYLQFNQFIRSGYRRPHSTLKACFSSFFQVHNETGNVWTHFLAWAAFLGFTYQAHFRVLYDAPLVHHIIFFVFLLSAQNCFLSSTSYHLLMCHSERTLLKVARLDYSGIAGLIAGSFFPAIFYAYYCYPYWQTIYLTGISILGLGGIIGPMFDFFHRDSFAWVRILFFAGTTATGLIPAIHHQFLPEFSAATAADAALLLSAAETTVDSIAGAAGTSSALFSFTPHPFLSAIVDVFEGMSEQPLTKGDIQMRLYVMYLFYSLGFFCYVTKFPECLRPGKFDRWFNSHQLWHVFVFLATMIHYFNCLNIYNRWNLLEKDSCPLPT